VFKKCLKFVCLSNPIRNELFYFSSFRRSDKTLLYVINVHEFESEVGFSLWPFIGQKLDQSETRFSIFHLFGILIKLCYRLSMSNNSNPRSDFSSELSLVRNLTNQKRALLFFVLSAFWEKFLTTWQFCQSVFLGLEDKLVIFLEVESSATEVLGAESWFDQVILISHLRRIWIFSGGQLTPYRHFSLIQSEFSG